jgi:hypothetical protein
MVNRFEFTFELSLALRVGSARKRFAKLFSEPFSLLQRHAGAQESGVYFQQPLRPMKGSRT